MIGEFEEQENRCPCGAGTTPRGDCDMCDGWQNDPDTGWGGFTDHYRKKHYNSEEEREEDIKQERYGF